MLFSFLVLTHTPVFRIKKYLLVIRKELTNCKKNQPSPEFSKLRNTFLSQEIFVNCERKKLNRNKKYFLHVRK